MSAIPIVCANCGAKYRLPETFEAPAAKCKACGGQIDVRSQIEKAKSGAEGKAAAPAKTAGGKSSSRTAAKAAKADDKPRVGSSRRSRRGADAAEGASGARASSRRSRARDDDDGDESSGGRRSRTREEKKGNPALLYGSLVGLVAVVVVVLIFVMGDGDKPAEDDTAKGGKADSAKSTDNDPGKKPAEPTKSAKETKLLGALAKIKEELEDAHKAKLDSLLTSAEGAAVGETLNAVVAGMAELDSAVQEKVLHAVLASEGVKRSQIDKLGNPEVKKAAEAALTSGKDVGKAIAAAIKKTAPKPRKKGEPLTSKDQVYDPKKNLPKLDYPDYISADDKAELDKLAEAARWSDASGGRARQKLEVMGHKSLVPLFNILRELDYYDAEDTMTAFAINKSLEKITVGITGTIETVDLGTDVSLDVAHKNGRAVMGWHQYWSKWKDQDDWADEITKRKKKQK